MKFVKDYETNIPFFDWFEAYAEAKQIDYPFGQSINVGNKSMQTWTNLKGEKFMSELPPQSPFGIKTSNSKKPIVAAPFQTNDISESVSAKDIRSLMEQNNYTNKYLQS